MTLNSSEKRIPWVDTARALGMFLVFYGHVVEAMVDEGYQAAFPQFKFIYSFHMPLFFIIAGFFFKRRFPTIVLEIRDLFFRRLIPVLIFGALTLPFWLLFYRYVFGYIQWDDLALRTYRYIQGHPDLNTITWFLICLFTTEVIAAFLLPSRNPVIILLLSLIFFRLGLPITTNIKPIVTILGIQRNTWYFHESLVAFGFYALGLWVFRFLRNLTAIHPLIRAVLAIIALMLTLLTFDLNGDYEGFVAIMKISEHGSAGWFLLTALTGTFFTLLLSTLLPRNRLVTFIGRNTLVYLGISGIFHEFINDLLVRNVPISDTTPSVILVSLLITLASIILSIPLVWFLIGEFPQLVGRPYQDGPHLPPLDHVLNQAKTKLLPGKLLGD
jgi:fucose 4-O-acetylase-like acetyltransferase